MIGVLTLFGETDMQEALRKAFEKKDAVFLKENCKTSVQLLSQLDELADKTNVVVMYSQAINIDTFAELVESIRDNGREIKIILILSGNRKQYLRSTLSEYNDMSVDLIFDDGGFEIEELLALLVKDRIKKSKKKESGFIDYEEITGTAKQINADEIVKDSRSNADYTTPECHVTIGIMNAARGAGATYNAYNLARYYSIQNYKTAICDRSGSGAIGLMKIKNVDLYADDYDWGILRRTYNIIISDYGTPLEITPDGTGFKLNRNYTPETIKAFNKSDIKIILGFTDSWNIGKIKYFFENEAWQEQFDRSYIFVVPSRAEALKKLYPDFNIMNKDEDYKEYILNVLREEEA